MLKVVQEKQESNENGPGSGGASVLDELVRDAARQMLSVALAAEVAAYVEAHVEEVDESGHRLVVRNGHRVERDVTTAAGPVTVKAPRVNDKRLDEVSGQRRRFASAILPAWARKSPRVAEVLPLLYLHGMSTNDFAPALTQFLGTSHGLSPATITRLTKDWQNEATAFNERTLAGTMQASRTTPCSGEPGSSPSSCALHSRRTATSRSSVMTSGTSRVVLSRSRWESASMR